MNHCNNLDIRQSIIEMSIDLGLNNQGEGLKVIFRFDIWQIMVYVSSPVSTLI